jgi:hypothetical protein
MVQGMLSILGDLEILATRPVHFSFAHFVHFGPVFFLNAKRRLPQQRSDFKPDQLTLTLLVYQQEYSAGGRNRFILYLSFYNKKSL